MYLLLGKHNLTEDIENILLFDQQ